jgi:hypothetical protein
MSLLDEAKELIEMSLKAGVENSEYTQKAQAWIEKTTEVQKAHTHHQHPDHEEGTSCSLCGFDLTCPSCGH